MPLSLVATPGASNANAYADVATADAYASYRVGGAAFIALTSDQKIQALVTATREIDTLEEYPGFIGARSTSNQALAWPREGVMTLPADLVSATIELAISYTAAITAGTDPLNASVGNGNIKVDKVGPISTEYFEQTEPHASALERLPSTVQRFLYGLVLSAVATWGSATVTRGS